jgi:hypothetical protein
VRIKELQAENARLQESIAESTASAGQATMGLDKVPGGSGSAQDLQTQLQTLQQALEASRASADAERRGHAATQQILAEIRNEKQEVLANQKAQSEPAESACKELQGQVQGLTVRLAALQQSTQNDLQTEKASHQATSERLSGAEAALQDLAAAQAKQLEAERQRYIQLEAPMQDATQQLAGAADSSQQGLQHQYSQQLSALSRELDAEKAARADAEAALVAAKEAAEQKLQDKGAIERLPWVAAMREELQEHQKLATLQTKGLEQLKQQLLDATIENERHLQKLAEVEAVALRAADAEAQARASAEEGASWRSELEHERQAVADLQEQLSSASRNLISLQSREAEVAELCR